MKKLKFYEQYGQIGERRQYLINESKECVNLKTCVEKETYGRITLISWMLDWLRFALLPQGYPQSVSRDYLSYQLWDTLQAFCSYLSGTLTTKAIMQGVGVGDSTATPLAATITWIMRDGTGMIGRIVFASWKGPSLDANCKQWRLAADILNDLALSIELCSPALPAELFPLALCIATSLKSIVGVAGGATRAALTLHQAQRGNMADVAAKDGSQETLVNLIASITGVFLLPKLEAESHSWLLFAVLTTIHVFANYKAVRCLDIPILNAQRYNLLLDSYFTSNRKYIETTTLINLKETVILGTGYTDQQMCGFKIKLGASLSDIEEITGEYLHYACVLSNNNFLILPNIKTKQIFVLFNDNKNPLVLLSYFHAVCLALEINNTLERNAKLVIESAMRNAQMYAEEEYPNFYGKAVKKGWLLERHQLLVNEWQVDWTHNH